MGENPHDVELALRASHWLARPPPPETPGRVSYPQLAGRVAGRDWTVRVLAAYLAEAFRGSGGGKSACRWTSFQPPSVRR